MKEEISQRVYFYSKLLPPFLSLKEVLLGVGKSLDLQRKTCGDAVPLVCWVEGVLVSGLWWKKQSVISLVQERGEVAFSIAIAS